MAAGCAGGSGNCSYRPSTTLSSGGHTWWIQTRNGAGDGAWSSSLNFTVAGTPPPGAGDVDIARGQHLRDHANLRLAGRCHGHVVLPMGQSGIDDGDPGMGDGRGRRVWRRNGQLFGTRPSNVLTPGAHTWWVQTSEQQRNWPVEHWAGLHVDGWRAAGRSDAGDPEWQRD